MAHECRDTSNPAKYPLSHLPWSLVGEKSFLSDKVNVAYRSHIVQLETMI